MEDEIKQFKEKTESLKKRGFYCYGTHKVSSFDSAISTDEATILNDFKEACKDIDDEGRAIGGPVPNFTSSIFVTRTSIKDDVSDIGTPDLGYISWGADNHLPSAIYRLAGASPYTASGLRFLVDLTCGNGPRLMYKYANYSNGTLTEHTIPFEQAGKYLQEEIAKVRAKIDERDKEKMVTERSNGEYIAPNTFMFKKDYRVKPEPEPVKEEKDYSMVGTLDFKLQELIADYREWESTIGEVEEFLDNNNLTENYQKCCSDDWHLDICFPTVSLSRGKVGSWKAKITNIGWLPAVCTRLEERDAQSRINFVYYSNKWRLEFASSLEKLDNDIVAYPTLDSDNALAQLRRKVNDNQKTAVSKRPTHFCIPLTYSNCFNDYYPQPAWWSIFTSLVYKYASTYIYDKAIEKQNSTMAAYLIYINNDWLERIFDQEGLQEKDEQEAYRDELIRDFESFLRKRENSGKSISLDGYIGPDGKTMQHSVEFVKVPVANSSTSKDDLEEIASIIFFALGLDPRLVGAVPGKNSSSSGTQNRELYLLKQQQVSNRQRTYLKFLNTISRFNGWDKHAEWVIKQPVLSTLDASKTGIVETESR